MSCRSTLTCLLLAYVSGVNLYFFAGEQIEAHCTDGHKEILFNDGTNRILMIMIKQALGAWTRASHAHLRTWGRPALKIIALVCQDWLDMSPLREKNTSMLTEYLYPCRMYC